MTTAGMTGFLGMVVLVLAGVSGWLWKRLRSATRAAKDAEAKMAALRNRIGKNITNEVQKTNIQKQTFYSKKFLFKKTNFLFKKILIQKNKKLYSKKYSINSIL